jgi:predicted PolB exonuclease-like 3'-5' exonuclease
VAIILDLETVAIDNAAAFIKPAGNLKDPAKIAASILERAEKASLNPWLCQTIAIGTCEEGEDVERVVTIASEPAEVVALDDLWRRIYDRVTGAVQPLVTFNGLSFDLPVLMARSMLLGVPHPTLNLDRYRSPHIDLLQRLSWNDPSKAHSLMFYCSRFGISTDDAFTGALIAQLHADGDWESIRKHCASDLRLTRQLAERVGAIKKRPVTA